MRILEGLVVGGTRLAVLPTRATDELATWRQYISRIGHRTHRDQAPQGPDLSCFPFNLSELASRGVEKDQVYRFHNSLSGGNPVS